MKDSHESQDGCPSEIDREPVSSDYLNELSRVTRELEKKNAQLESIKNQEIDHELADQGKAFAAAIAHMVNNTMMKIAGGIEILSMNANLNESANSVLTQIRESVRQSTHLVDRLLMISEENTEPLHSFCLEDTVKSVIERYAAESVHINFRQIAAHMVFGHRRLVILALGELIDNALDASRTVADGTALLTIRVEEPDARRVSVMVSDGGAGVDEAIQSDLFKPFVTTRGLGRGLGLAIVRHAAKAVKGDVLWRRVGETTEFEFIVPKESPHDEQQT